VENKQVLLEKVDTMKYTINSLTKSISAEKFIWRKQNNRVACPFQMNW